MGIENEIIIVKCAVECEKSPPKNRVTSKTESL